MEWVFWFLETDVRLDDTSQTFFEVTTSCSIFRLCYSEKECLYLTAISGCFLALRECLSSGQLTSSKEKIWPTAEFKRINAIHCAQCSWPDVRKTQKKKYCARWCHQFLLQWNVYLWISINLFDQSHSPNIY